LKLNRHQFFPLAHTVFNLPEPGDGQGAGAGTGGQGQGGAGGSGGAGAGSASSSSSGSAGDDDKIEFSPAQQRFLEDKINEAYARGASKAEKTFQTQITDLQAQVTELKKPKPPKGGDKGGEGDGQGEKTFSRKELDQILAERDKEWDAKVKPEREAREAAEKRAQDLLTKDKTAALVSAAAKAKAVDPEEVSQLLEGKIGHDDDGKLIVLNETIPGAAKLGKDGKPLSIDQFVADWIDARPHHKAGSGNPGAGSGSRNNSPGGAGGGAAPKTFQEANAALAKTLSGAK